MAGTSGNQYFIMNALATSSAANVIAQLNQKFQPNAKPKALSTYREA